MTLPIIEVENLSKRYRLGQFNARTLREEFQQLFRRERGDGAAGGPPVEDFWALKDVSFSVQRGEVLGIIGRNGAGKSTLLKILSRITEPTTGEIRIRGRVASLLEVGTGFHPELTGRENIYLNGAILGMRRREIARKFDEIIDFSGVEKFLDTPVKRYSSGMYVRLAFAVAAHLEPEILIVDEVLAVGDGEFQKKCLNRMEVVSDKENRSIVFVSHNMNAIRKLCGRSLRLDHGRLADFGPTAGVVDRYVQSARDGDLSAGDRKWEDINSAPGNDRIKLRQIVVLPQDGASADLIDMRAPFVVEVIFWNLVARTKVFINAVFYTADGTEVFEGWSTDDTRCPATFLDRGLFKAKVGIPGHLLNAGDYQVGIAFFEADVVRRLYRLEPPLPITIHERAERSINWHGRIVGFVHPKLDWSIERVEELVA